MSASIRQLSPPKPKTVSKPLVTRLKSDKRFDRAQVPVSPARPGVDRTTADLLRSQASLIRAKALPQGSQTAPKPQETPQSPKSPRASSPKSPRGSTSSEWRQRSNERHDKKGLQTDATGRGAPSRASASSVEDVLSRSCPRFGSMEQAQDTDTQVSQKSRSSQSETQRQIPKASPDPEAKWQSSGAPSQTPFRPALRGQDLEAKSQSSTAPSQTPSSRPTPRGQRQSPSACLSPALSFGCVSDSDIRCASAVSLGQSFSVWCGERDGSITVRNPDTTAVWTVLPKDHVMNDFVWCIFQDGERVLVGMSSGRLRVYCATSQRLLFERIRHAGGIYALACLGELVYSASNDFTIGEWHRSTLEPTNRILGEHMNQVRCLCVCAGYLVSGGDDNVIRVWEVGATIRTMCFPRNDSVLALTSVPKSQDFISQRTEGEAMDTLWAGDNQGDLSVYDLQQSSCVASIQGHTGAIINLLHRQGLLFSSSVDKTVKVWAPALQVCLQTVNAHTSYLAGLLPIASCTQIRLWSFGGDKKLRSWNLECSRPGVEDEIERLWDKSQHQALQVAQLTVECKASRHSIQSKEQEIERLSKDFKAQQVEWSKTKQDQYVEIERLSTTLALREGVLQTVMLELEEARSLCCKLEQEKERLLVDRDKAEKEHRTAWEHQQCEKERLISKLEETSQENRDMKLELQELHEQYKASEQDLEKHVQGSHSLQRQLTQALEVTAVAEQRNKVLEEQVGVQETLKTSRLGFVSEVWSLHKAMMDLQATSKTSRSPRPKLTRRATSPEQNLVNQSMTNACNHSAKLISKYLTDEEKLHLGVPLAHYEGGHASPRPLNWTAAASSASQP